MADSPIIERQAYSVGEFAEMWSVSRGYLYKLRAQGKLTITKIGGRSVILREESDRFSKEIRGK